MSTIILRYSNTPLGSLTFSGTATEQHEFDPAINLPPLPVQELAQGKLLNGRRYSHILYTHLLFDFTISADELTDIGDLDTPEVMPASKAFLRDFLLAKYKYISYPAGSNYIEVIKEGNAIEVTYIEEYIYLPEFRLQLITASPVDDTTLTNLALKPISMV